MLLNGEVLARTRATHATRRSVPARESRLHVQSLAASFVMEPRQHQTTIAPQHELQRVVTVYHNC